MPVEVNNVPPGYVSAFLFIVFDLVLLSLWDFALSRYLSAQYLHRIFKRGDPIRVRSVDVPGVTTFMLGQSLVFPRVNLLALAVKLALLAAVFGVEFSLDAKYESPSAREVFLNSLVFDASEQKWPFRVAIVRRVERAWLQARSCRTVDRTNQTATFYPLVFNLSNGGVLPSESNTIPGVDVYPGIDDVERIDRASLRCLSSAEFPSDLLSSSSSQTDTSNTSSSTSSNNNNSSNPFPHHQHWLLHVTGCTTYFYDANNQNYTTTTTTTTSTNTTANSTYSPVKTGTDIDMSLPYCHIRHPVSVALHLPLGFTEGFYKGVVRIPEGTKRMTFQYFLFPPEWYASSFPGAYGGGEGVRNASLICLRTRYGPQSSGGVELKRKARLIVGCMFVVARSTETFIEYWDYDESSGVLTRDYAGPIFRGYVEIATFHVINLLTGMLNKKTWLDLASQLFAEALIYQPLTPQLRATRINPDPSQRTIVSTLPIAAVVVLVVLAVAACVTFTVAVYAARRSTMPQLNTIDGISSIAREECVPTGRSVGRGRPVTVGLRATHGGELHFGPLYDPAYAVKRSKGVKVV